MKLTGPRKSYFLVDIKITFFKIIKVRKTGSCVTDNVLSKFVIIIILSL